MLPFVRMFEYGNINPVDELVDLRSGIRHFMALRNNGDVYSTGINANSQCGMNDKSYVTRNRWNKCLINNVKRIICGGYSSIAITNDNKVMMCGRKSPTGSPLALNEIYEVWTDVTDKFTQFLSVIDSITIKMSTFNIFVLNGTDLYSMGLSTNSGRSTGSGLTSDTTTFVQVASNVSKLYCTDYSAITFYIDTSRDVYGCGINSVGSMGNNSVNDIYAFTKLSCPIKVNHISCDVQSGCLFFGDSLVYKTGSALNGGLGDGAISGNYTSFTLHVSIPSSLDITKIQSTSLMSSPGLTLLIVDGSLWESGYDNYGAGGTGSSTSNKVYFEKLAVQPNISSMKLVASQYTTYVWNGKELWCTGDPESLPSVTNFYTFTKISFPWI